jgi:BASS family bile acid:Na+ symporter
MDKGSRIAGVLTRFFWIFFYIVGIGILLPVIIGVLAGFPAGYCLSFVLSAFALQAAVPPVGVALGLPVPLILVILACFATGVVLGIYEICRTLGSSSKRVSAFIEKVEKKTEKYPMIRKYGPVTCILIAWIPGIGLYGTPVISWMIGWKRIPSVICTAAGFLIASIFVLFFASRINEVLWFAGLAGLLVYAVTLSLAMGFALPGSRITSTTRQSVLLLLLIAVNFILVPVAASLLSSFLGLPASASAGLILISVSAGAPSLFGFLQKAGGNMARLAPLFPVLGVVTVFYIPLILPFLLPGYDPDPVMMAAYLVLLILIPLAAGLYLRPRHEAATVRWAPWLDKISWVAFAVVIITLLALFTTAFLQIPATMSVLAAVLLILISYGSGYIAGGTDPNIRQIFAQGTAQRNLAASLILAILVFRDESVMAIVLITGLIGLVPFLIWWSMRKRRQSSVKSL